MVGLQELQRSQRRALTQIAGDRYAVYSPPGDTDNSIAWRRDRWAFVSADTVPIPYFHGNRGTCPSYAFAAWHSGGEAIFVNVHNPADVRGNAARFRREAIRRELAVMRSLASRYDAPAFLTGDLNERRSAFCALTAGGTLTALRRRFARRALRATETLRHRLDLRHQPRHLDRPLGRADAEAERDQRPPAGRSPRGHRHVDRRRTVTDERRYPYFGKPPAREPRPAVDVPALRGKRVILSTPDGFVYDMRAVSQIQRDGDGREVIEVVTEEDYFRWMFTKASPTRSAFPKELVWVE